MSSLVDFERHYCYISGNWASITEYLYQWNIVYCAFISFIALLLACNVVDLKHHFV